MSSSHTCTDHRLRFNSTLTQQLANALLLPRRGMRGLLEEVVAACPVLPDACTTRCPKMVPRLTFSLLPNFCRHSSPIYDLHLAPVSARR